MFSEFCELVIGPTHCIESLYLLLALLKGSLKSCLIQGNMYLPQDLSFFSMTLGLEL